MVVGQSQLGAGEVAVNTCEWCGHEHDVRALCTKRKRGLSRRSFLILGATAAVGAMLPAIPLPKPVATIASEVFGTFMYGGVPVLTDRFLPDGSFIIISNAVTIDWYKKLVGVDARYLQQDGGLTYGELQRSAAGNLFTGAWGDPTQRK